MKNIRFVFSDRLFWSSIKAIFCDDVFRDMHDCVLTICLLG